MSRCFPYDPLPRDAEQSGALIESIKKKAKKGEKRKREKKHKKHHGLRMDDEKHGQMHGKHGERDQLDGENHRHPKPKDESEQLEKSGLTEENGLPYVRSTRREDSPDSSSQYSCKIVDGPSDMNRVSHGNLLLRIKVPVPRPKKPDQPTKPEEPEPPGAISTVVPEPPSSSGRTESAAPEQQPCQRLAEGGLSGERFQGFLGSRRSRKRGAKYEDLFGSLCLQPLHAECLPPDDDDWILGSNKAKQQVGDVPRLQPETKISGDPPSSLSAWPPKACYLPEADLHVLPFVVPF